MAYNFPIGWETPNPSALFLALASSSLHRSDSPITAKSHQPLQKRISVGGGSGSPCSASLVSAAAPTHLSCFILVSKPTDPLTHAIGQTDKLISLRLTSRTTGLSVYLSVLITKASISETIPAHLTSAMQCALKLPNHPSPLSPRCWHQSIERMNAPVKWCAER